MQIKVSLLFVLGTLSVALANASPSSGEAKEVKAEKAEGKWIPSYIWSGLYHEKRAEEGINPGLTDGLYHDKRAEEGINPGLTDGLYHDKRGETKQKEGKYIPAYIWDGLYTEKRHGETGKVVDGKWIPSYIWSGLYTEKSGETKQKTDGKWIPSYIWSGLYTEKSSEKSSSSGMKRKRAEEGINPGLTDGLYHDKRAEEGINPGLTDGLSHERQVKEDGEGIPPYIGRIMANGN
ncbi:hypothetical protein MYAM1_000210 [Malassezia yamatoensis]|uniref:Uncharacterized protein n=1 Tax=Malassezia yamatoensis TaxID=253288 RepID=A0AAJ6CH64_9BASI|nr:hypothetical protein MYAM1_000210 [Malassezia yamatoensis]